MSRPTRQSILVGKQIIPVSNLEKVLYPQTGFTKAQVLDYYRRVAPALLPHLAGRALTLKRYPDGVEAPFFYEKTCPSHRPAWIKTARVPSGKDTDEVIEYCRIDSLAALTWVANLASLELHVPLSRADSPDRPTAMVFDLDPGLPAGLLAAARLALDLRTLLRHVGLECYPKTSGGKGIHVYVPLNSPVSFQQTKTAARWAAEELARQQPERVTSVMRKDLRSGKVLVDWSQHDRHKTTVCVYSLRAREQPTVSAPVTWREVARAVRTGKTGGLELGPGQVLARLARNGDLFAPVLTQVQRLPGA